MKGRQILGWSAAGGVLAFLVTGVALVRAPLPPSPRGPEPGRSVFQTHCATCHGAAGRGDSWRARLLLLRPGDLSSPAISSLPDRYLVDLIRLGGSSFGKPGMPSFGFVLNDAEIEAVVQYLRSLPRAPRDLGQRGTRPAARAPTVDDRGVGRLGGWAGRHPLVAAGPHALVEDARVEVSDRHELDALRGSRPRSRADALGRNGAIPVRPGRAFGLVPPALGLGPARALPADAGRARSGPEGRQGQGEHHGSPHGLIVPRTASPW